MCRSYFCAAFNTAVSLCSNSDGVKTPNSVTMPPVISSAGVTSNAGFQQLIPGTFHTRHAQIHTHTRACTHKLVCMPPSLELNSTEHDSNYSYFSV